MADQQNQNNNTEGSTQASGSREQFVSPVSGGGTPTRLLFFSFGLFIFVLLIYGGLQFGYSPYLDGQIEEVDNQIDELSSRVSPEEQRELSLFYTRISNIDFILNNRLLGSRVFGFLENTVHPDIYYSSVQYFADSGTIEITGNAESLGSLSEQLAVFNERDDVAQTLISDIQSVGPFLNFEMSLDVQPLLSTNNN